MTSISRKTIEAFYRGEPWASRAVFERYRKLVYFALSTILKEKCDIDDAYQDVFLRLFKNKPSFADDGMGLPTYLVKSAKSIAINMAKRSNRICLADMEAEAGGRPQTVSYIVSKYLSPPLSELEGQIVAYRAAFSLSFSEVSEVVGVPETTVRRIYKQSLKRIRKEYKDDDSSQN